LGVRRRITVAGLYAGGFLGPFAGGIPVSMLPELGASFDVSATTASISLTAYLVPFAAFLLVSGTLGARWGARRSVLMAYLVYVLSSLLCAAASAFPLFLAGRAIQGMSNAFTTPLLLTAIAASTPPERLGRALGWFSALQAAGMTSAPLLGGLTAEVNWRLAFIGVALVSVALAAVGLPEELPDRQEAAKLRTAWEPAVLRIGAVALIAWGCLGGISFLVAIRAQDAFGLGAAARGLLLTGSGLVGMFTARGVGHVIDKVGGRRAAVLGGFVGAVPVALIGVLGWLPAVAVLWALSGVATQLLLVGMNSMALTGDLANPAGAVSVVQAFRFIGAALAPIALTPVYHAWPAGAFLLPAALLMFIPPVAVLRI
jgi:predicted MFS family arabinose efflux permease